MRRPLRRAAGLLPGALLIAALALPGSAAADTAPAAESGTVLENPAAAAATWAATKLQDGTSAGQDYGLTADIVMGLASTGTDGATAERATGWLAENAQNYIEQRGAGGVFAGAAAKLALVAEVQGQDAADFGGVDLTEVLLDRLQESGRFTDAPSDLSNQFTQSLAVLALARTGELPETAVDFLASTQCPNGGFPLSLNRNPNVCNADIDSTGMAVQALEAAGRTAEIPAAMEWLAGVQNDNGGFGYNAVSAPNSNSTALAVQALLAGNRTAEAAAGQEWLLTVQVGCDAVPADRGAVGYDKPIANGMALRATAQVIPALAGKTLGELDGRGATPEPYRIDCAPPDGGNGGNGDDNGGQNGGNDGGGDGQNGGGGDDGANGGDNGGSGDDGGDNGDNGGDNGATGDGDNGGTSGGATSDSTTGTTGTTGGPGGTTGGSGDTGNQPVPDGGLASTGTSALTIGLAAVTLLVLGAAAYVLSMRRRRAGASAGTPA